MLRILSWLLDLFGKLFEHLWMRSYTKASTVIQEKARLDAHAAVIARARLKRKRVFYHTFFHSVIFLIFGGLVTAMLLTKEERDIWFYLFLVLFIYYALRALYYLLFGRTGNLSTLEVTDVIGSERPYALYLRAFKTDGRERAFSEISLVQALLNQNIVTYAVGLPEEIDATPGAMRVYISNDTWQQDVRMMMEKAVSIFVRVCQTEPCFWEISQVLELPNPLYLIVDNLEEYQATRTQYPQLPEVTQLKPGKYFIFQRIEDGTWENLTPEKTYDEQSQKDFSALLLDKYPILQEGNEKQYMDSIKGLYSEITDKIDAFKPEYILPVAERILNQIEAFSKMEDPDGNVLYNNQTFLKMHARFDPLPEALQKKREQLRTDAQLQ